MISGSELAGVDNRYGVPSTRFAIAGNNGLRLNARRWDAERARGVVLLRTASRRFRCLPVAVMPCVWLWSCPMLTRLAPAQLVEPFVGNAEVVRDFVDHRHGHLMDDIIP